MSKEVSNELFKSESNNTNNIINNWLESTGIYKRIQYDFDPNENAQHKRVVASI